MKFFGTATIGVKGQLVVPIEAREFFNLNEGDKLLVFSAPLDKGIVLVTADALKTITGDFQKDGVDIQRDVQEMKKIIKEQDEGKK